MGTNIRIGYAAAVFMVSLLGPVACFGQCNHHPLRPSMLPPCPPIMDRMFKATVAHRNQPTSKAEDRITQEPAPAWQVGQDGVLTIVGPVGDVVKRFGVTPSSDTSLATVLASAK